MHGSGLAAGDLEQQLRGALDRALLVRRIHAAFEALAGVGDEAIAAAAARDGGRREERGFEQHIDGVGAARPCALHP